MTTLFKRFFFVLFFGLGLLVGSLAVAQEFPERTVRIVVPYPPGGFNDTLARVAR